MDTERERLIASLKADLINNPMESTAPTYQPIYFDDFCDIETSLDRRGFYEKCNLILGCLEQDLSLKTVLDIGSNAGYFSFAAASRNAIVDALEPLPHYFHLCQRLCEIYDIPNINFINGPITMEFLVGKKYDYGFMLSVFQWISAGDPEFGKRILMETSRHVDTLFFELGCNRGKSAVKTSKLNHLAYIHYLLRRNTIYKNIKLIGTTKIWKSSTRYIFVCSRRDMDVREPFYSFLKWACI